MEEAQHAKLDTLMVEALADGAAPSEIDAGRRRVPRDRRLPRRRRWRSRSSSTSSFQRATGRELTETRRSEFATSQLQANRWTYLGSGMTHERFLTTLGSLSTAAKKRVEQVAPAFS